MASPNIATDQTDFTQTETWARLTRKGPLPWLIVLVLAVIAGTFAFVFEQSTSNPDARPSYQVGTALLVEGNAAVYANFTTSRTMTRQFPGRQIAASTDGSQRILTIEVTAPSAQDAVQTADQLVLQLRGLSHRVRDNQVTLNVENYQSLGRVLAAQGLPVPVPDLVQLQPSFPRIVADFRSSLLAQAEDEATVIPPPQPTPWRNGAIVAFVSLVALGVTLGTALNLVVPKQD